MKNIYLDAATPQMRDDLTFFDSFRGLKKWKRRRLCSRSEQLRAEVNVVWRVAVK
jgi:hypothetical protein